MTSPDDVAALVAELNRLAEKYRQAVRALHLAVGPVEAVHWLRKAADE